MNLSRMAKRCGVSGQRVMMVQKSFGLPASTAYSDGFAVLVSKIIWLQIASIPKKMIQTQLSREHKLLELLKVDSLTHSPTWFEDLCVDKFGPKNLLLSGYDLGHRAGVQTGLDFAERDSELFASSEMGNDALRALKLCMESQEKILARLRQEIPVLSFALKWSRKVTT